MAGSAAAQQSNCSKLATAGCHLRATLLRRGDRGPVDDLSVWYFARLGATPEPSFWSHECGVEAITKASAAAMDGGTLNRLSQLRACTALVEKGDAATLGRRLADMAECLARQQLLLETHQPPASPSADLSRPAAAGAASGLSAQLAAAQQQQQQQGATQTVASVNAWVASVQKLLNRTQVHSVLWAATGRLLHASACLTTLMMHVGMGGCMQTQATGALLLGATAACCSLGRLAASFASWGTALSDLLRKEQAQGTPRKDVQRACFVALAQMLIR